MPECPLSQLLIRPKHLALLQALLQQTIPQAEVWAYGSRVTGQAHESSDVDLVVRNPVDLTQFLDLTELKEQLLESDLPLHVDVVDWARVPVHFHEAIQAAYVIITPLIPPR
ncbi:MAG: hypothetical protein A3J38_02095 [Gammaproteobacteria bacterium RIFCSPHIGHO2_12_FULL_45_9]|nr:MAG: hypothetical protein A3J38_02095 [Gammaproteobacteria bacterium RIFCSPHIGHO2_12_FULL_45_9]